MIKLNGLMHSLGVTRRYNFTIGRGEIAPSGLRKPALLANNQFPGVSDTHATAGSTFPSAW